ncbi:hypothetical protein D9M68_980400 [compost metagenome]
MSNATRKVSGTLAACSQASPGGTTMASAASITAYAEKAPGQRPITRSPGLKPVTSDPTAITSPAPSPPIAFQLPAWPCRPWPSRNSPRLSDAARMRTSNCRGSGVGIGLSRSSSTVSVSVICIQ